MTALDEDGGQLQLSVVVTTESADSVLDLIAHLEAQTAAERIELLIVAPAGSDRRFGDFRRGRLARVRVIEAGEGGILPSLAEAAAEGVRAASADVVAFTETHCYPEPGWAAALIAAHRGDCVAVGPTFVNGNPETLISRSNMMVDYGAYVGPEAAGPVSAVAGKNSSYKRDALLAYGAELGKRLDAPWLLDADLIARGGRMLVAADARTHHFNVSRPRSWLAERFHAGRGYAAARSREWSRPRRLLYALGSPLIPVVRLARVIPLARRQGLLPAVLPYLIIGLVASSAGELFGFSRGVGEAMAKLRHYELRRFEHVRRGELASRPPGEPSPTRLGAGSDE